LPVGCFSPDLSSQIWRLGFFPAVLELLRSELGVASATTAASNKAALFSGVLEVEGVGAVELLLAGRGGEVKQQLGGELPARSGWSGAAALLLACRGSGGKHWARSLCQGALCVVTDSSVAMFLRPTSRPAVAARKRRTKEVWLLGAGGGAGGFWGLHPLQQLPSGGYGALPLFSATGVVLLRSACVARACSSSFGGGSYRISAWRPSLRLPQVVSSPVEAAAAAPGGLRPSTAKLDSIASVRSLLGCFL
jgi:hypothetical protein